MTIDIVLGALLAGAFCWFLGKLLYDRKLKDNLSHEPTQHKLHLKEEELEIHKSKVKTGEVIVYKEIVEEQKNITVPINHEELVIVSYEVHGNQKEKKEVIRIPLSEEEVVVTKHPVQVAEVSVSKNNVTEMKQINETLKKEQVHYEVIGLAEVQDGDSFEETQR